MTTDETKALVARSDFGATELQLRATEVASKAVAAQAEAQVKARFFMAMQRPRQMLEVRERILADCKRPEFARNAIYQKPMGGSVVEGLSIRFVEAVLCAMGNVSQTALPIFDDDVFRLILIDVCDLETNANFSQVVTIQKTVERRSDRGREVISERENAAGKKLYTVKATDDELITKQAALVSKAIRTCGLRIIPAHLREDAEEEARRTMSAGSKAVDPKAEAKQIADAFVNLRVNAADLEEYLGHPLDKASATTLEDLRRLYVAIRDEEVDWMDALESRRRAREETDTKKAKIKKAAEKVAEAVAPKPKEAEATPEPSLWPPVKLSDWRTACGEADIKKAEERNDIVKRRFGKDTTEKSISDGDRGELLAWLEGDFDALEAMKEATKGNDDEDN